MLSILIPVYNNNVVKLVKELHDQCIRSKILFEILVFDDGSSIKFKQQNKALNGIFGVNYLELSKNIGRSRIRNKLAKTAGFDFLLFLDADSKISSRKFIKNYVANLEENTVLNGGRIYSKKPPKAKSKLLHWKYGAKNESQEARLRNNHPVRYFHTNNFVIPRSIMIKTMFDESINQYGYEDLLFAHQLEKDGCKIKHIDNFIIHNELEPKVKFIKKQVQALENLNRLVNNHSELDVRIWNLYKSLSKYSLDKLLVKVFGPASKIQLRLENKSDNLLQLQLFKLLTFIELRSIS